MAIDDDEAREVSSAGMETSEEVNDVDVGFDPEAVAGAGMQELPDVVVGSCSFPLVVCKGHSNFWHVEP